LSVLPDWSTRVRDTLAKLGVILITLEHLPGTFVDGAAICRGDGVPVIALTLRHDRVDNFWFTLLHEIAHVRRASGSLGCLAPAGQMGANPTG
jgi:HTH-type transcriptional regulator/antitoxin HigA